jgi:putative hemolysin
MIWNFILIFVLVIINGFFVAAEFAVITARKTRVRLQAEKGSAGAKLVLHWLEDSAARNKLIAAAQLGITIVSLALGAVGENTFEILLEPVFHSMEIPFQWARIEPILAALPLVISLIIVTSLHVVLGEQVPKVAALGSPEKIAIFSATPMKWFSTIFAWFVNVLDWATQGILRLGGGVSGTYTKFRSRRPMAPLTVRPSSDQTMKVVGSGMGLGENSRVSPHTSRKDTSR